MFILRDDFSGALATSCQQATDRTLCHAGPPKRRPWGAHKYQCLRLRMGCHMTSPGIQSDRSMEVAIHADRQGDHGYLVPSGPFDLLHAAAVARSLDTVRSRLERCRSVELDLAHLDRIDGTGAALLARLLDRLDAGGLRTHSCRITTRKQPA